MIVFAFSLLVDDRAAAVAAALLQRVSAYPGEPEARQLIRVFGKGDVLALVCLLVGAAGLVRAARGMLVALLMVGIAVATLKCTVPRDRPNGSPGRSFPSGDTASIAAIAVPAAAAVPVLTPVAAAAVATVAGLRVLDGFHYPSDVFFAIAFGVLAGTIALFPRVTAWLPLGRRGCVGLLLLLVVERSIEYAISGRALLFRHVLIIFGPALLLWFAFGRSVVDRESFETENVSSTPRLFFDVDRMPRALLLLGILAGYVLIAHLSSLWDRDEPRYAQATVEMLRSGDYLVPTFNAALRPDKPILIYWLMSLPVRLFGHTELAFRGVAIAASFLAGLFTFLIGRRLFDARTAFLGVCFLLTTPLMMISGTAATTDAVLLACIMGAMLALLDLSGGRATWRQGVGLWLALGLALLVKGPVGLAIPLLTMLVLGIRSRGRGTAGANRRVWVIEGLAVILGVALFLAWALPANEATGGEFLRQGLGRHVLKRSVQPLESHGGSYLLFLFYYLPVMLLTFLPWTLFLPGGLVALRRGRVGAPHAAGFLV